MLPLCLNLSGSAFYYYLLSESNLSRTVPIVNSLSFIASLTVGVALGEKIASKKEILGFLLIIAGVLITLI